MNTKLTTQDYLVFLETLKDQTEKNSKFSMVNFCKSLNVDNKAGRILVDNDIISMERSKTGQTRTYKWICKLEPNLKMAEKLRSKLSSKFMPKILEYKGIESIDYNAIDTPIVKSMSINIYVNKAINFLKKDVNNNFIRLHDCMNRISVGKEDLYLHDIPNQNLVDYIYKNVAVFESSNTLFILLEFRKRDGLTSRKKDAVVLSMESKLFSINDLFTKQENFATKPLIDQYREMSEQIDDWNITDISFHNGKSLQDNQKIAEKIEEPISKNENKYSLKTTSVEKCIEILKATGAYRIQRITYQEV